jgi:aspartate aminotransferase
MVAKRLQNVPESGTVRVANLVSRMREEGTRILSFSMGEPDFPTPDYIIDACVDSLHNKFTHYTPSAGIPDLRRAVAERVTEDNRIPCEMKNVLITPTKQAIFMTCLAFLDEGDEVILPDPTWGTYDACIRLTGAKPVYVPTIDEEDFRMTPERVAEKVTPRTKMILMNSPSNPTGAVLTREDVQGIADIVKDNDLMVMSDEVYEKIIYEGEHVPIASLDGMFERTITVNGFSKSFAMTGWRLGWMVAPEAWIKAVNKLQTHSLTCAVSFVQKAGVEALKGPKEAQAKMVREFKHRRDLVYDLIDDIPGIQCSKPKGAFYLFPSYDFDMSSEKFVTHLLQEAHVAVTPGAAFGPSGEGHFRLSYAASEEDLKEGMALIKKAIVKL